MSLRNRVRRLELEQEELEQQVLYARDARRKIEAEFKQLLNHLGLEFVDTPSKRTIEKVKKI